MSETPRTTRPIRVFNRPVSLRGVMDAVKRIQPIRDGQHEMIRFSVAARIEHLVVMTAIFVLAVTGLAQTFDTTRIGQAILILLGGLEGAQQVHHLFALVLMAVGIYHFLYVLDSIFVKRQPAQMLPTNSDFRHIFQMLTFNLGFSQKLPLFDRYSFDEKFVYWVTVIAVGVLSLTGLVIWFPILVTQILPGSFFLFAGTLHRWQAIFIVVVIVFLHLYQVLVRKQNFSIFSGKMPVVEMKSDHPVELAYLEQIANLSETTDLPRMVKFSIDELVVARAPKAPRPAKSKAVKAAAIVETQANTIIKTADQIKSDEIPANHPTDGEVL